MGLVLYFPLHRTTNPPPEPTEAKLLHIRNITTLTSSQDNSCQPVTDLSFLSTD